MHEKEEGGVINCLKNRPNTKISAFLISHLQFFARREGGQISPKYSHFMPLNIGIPPGSEIKRVAAARTTKIPKQTP